MSCVYHGGTKGEGCTHTHAPSNIFTDHSKAVVSAVVYYFCQCMYLYVCPGVIRILDSRLASFLGKKLPFWLSACSVLIVVQLL